MIEGGYIAPRLKRMGGAAMSRPFIVFGDHTDHGGVVIEASVMSKPLVVR